MKKFEIVKSKARIVSECGMLLVGALLEKAGIRRMANQMPVAIAHPQNVISEGDVIVTAISRMCAGFPKYESVRDCKGDPEFYMASLGLENIISPERERQRLDQNARGEESGEFRNHDEIRMMNIAVLAGNKAPVSPLPCGFVPVDCDVTPYDESKSHKEGVSRTYKNFDGYAPMDAHIGVEGYFINSDFREGKVHSQNGTPEFIVETIDLAHKLTSEKLLFRLDSGNDSADNMGVIMERGAYFIIKRNLRKESRDGWLELAECNAPFSKEVRDGKWRYVGSTWKEISYIGMDGQAKTKTVRIVYEVIKRTIDKHGQVLLLPDIEVNTWWDNTGLSDEIVIELYHKHGTMEQFHAELKSEINMEKLPSGKFATNRLLHELSMIAYNVLRILGDKLCDIDCVPMRAKADRRRLRTVIMNIIRIPARIARSSRSFKADVGSSNPWSDTFIRLDAMVRQA